MAEMEEISSTDPALVEVILKLKRGRGKKQCYNSRQAEKARWMGDSAGLSVVIINVARTCQHDKMEEQCLGTSTALFIGSSK